MYIIKYSPDYKQQLLAFLKFKWADLDEKQREELFKWRYEQNPYSDKPIIYLAIDSNIIVGFRAFVPQLFIYKDSFVQILSPADAIVHPDYRRKGIFNQLNSYFLDDKNSSFLVLNLSSNQYSTPGNLKQGWIDTGFTKQYCFKLSFSSYFRKALQKDNILATGFYRRPDLNLTFEVSDRLDSKALAEYIKKQRNPNKLMNVRDESYFNWRYSYKRSQYLFIYCHYKTELKGYTIVKSISSKQSAVMEYYADDEPILKMLLKVAMQAMAKPILRTLVLTEEEKTRLKKCGFIGEPQKLLSVFNKKRLPVLIRTAHMDKNNNEFLRELDLLNISNWDIQLADVH